VVESSVWFLMQVRVRFNSGAWWSSVVVRLRSLHSRIDGFVLCFLPRPYPAGRQIWDVKILKITTWWFAAEPLFLGVTSLEAASEDFPVATGTLPSIQGAWTSTCDGASSSRSGYRRCWSLEGLLCNIYYFQGFFVRSNYL
jgi:hypothetical protein